MATTSRRSRRGRGQAPLPPTRGWCVFRRSWQGLVGAVAQWLLGGMLAGAEPVVARFFGRVFHGREASSLVGPIAECLVLAHPAGAPPIVLARFERHFHGRSGRDNRLGHLAFPIAAALLRCRANPL